MTYNKKIVVALFFIATLLIFSACNTNHTAGIQSANIEAFMEAGFTCPNQEIIDAIESIDGGYIAEDSVVAGDGELIEDKLDPLLADYVEKDYIRTIALEYVGKNHFLAEENGSTSVIESLEITGSEDDRQYTFQLQLTCQSSVGTKTSVEMRGSIYLNDEDKINMLKIHSGFDQYLKMLES